MSNPHQPPRRAVTRQPMSLTATAVHWLLILCTAGAWYPVDAAARRKRRTVTTYR